MEPEDELNSFPYDATVGGTEHHYRITQNDGKYGIEQDGVVIAEVSYGDCWQQVAGKPLSNELLQSICNHIAAHSS